MVPLRGSMPPTVSRVARADAATPAPSVVDRGGVGAGRGAERAGVHPVGDHPGGDAPPSAQLLRHRRRHTDVDGGRDDGSLVAGDQLWGGEDVEMVNGAHQPAAGAGEGSVGRDAVLGVDDIEPAGVRRGRRRARRCSARPARRTASPGRSTSGRTRRSTAGSTGRKNARSPPRPTVSTVTSRPGDQGLRQGEGVDHPAAGPGGVGEQGDAHPGQPEGGPPAVPIPVTVGPTATVRSPSGHTRVTPAPRREPPARPGHHRGGPVGGDAVPARAVGSEHGEAREAGQPVPPGAHWPAWARRPRRARRRSRWPRPSCPGCRRCRPCVTSLAAAGPRRATVPRSRAARRGCGRWSSPIAGRGGPGASRPRGRH